MIRMHFEMVGSTMYMYWRRVQHKITKHQRCIVVLHNKNSMGFFMYIPTSGLFIQIPDSCHIWINSLEPVQECPCSVLTKKITFCPKKTKNDHVYEKKWNLYTIE